MTVDLAELATRIERLEAEVAAIRAVVVDAAPDRSHDPVRWRRFMLRELRRRFYRFMSRSGAAIAISADWRAFAEARANHLPDPGTREAVFAELIAGGCEPMSARTIQSDLVGL
ncbi:hypothetical protein [Acuticoccus sediminis]|uniref:hypothetical protein n=1 Tax=Acuticoccus sediminis TaxID=2184697 RepID=UPI001CFD2998|nr:hypothetical protein [Acuticoccus sediminis]